MEQIEKHVGELLALLERNGAQRNREGMARFGIRTEHAYGVGMPLLRAEARRLGHDHPLALALWESGRHEARILASLVADARLLTPQQMDAWVEAVDSWDLCDQCCMNLFRHTSFAYEPIARYAADEREFVRRTAFSLIATLASGDKKSPDERFVPLLDLVERYAGDPRNFVRKSVNWALRQIGKRSLTLLPHARALAARLAACEQRSARWVGRDALRELEQERIIARIRRP